MSKNMETYEEGTIAINLIVIFPNILTFCAIAWRELNSLLQDLREVRNGLDELPPRPSRESSATRQSDSEPIVPPKRPSELDSVRRVELERRKMVLNNRIRQHKRRQGITGLVPPVTDICPDIIGQFSHSVELLHIICLGIGKKLLEVFDQAEKPPVVALLHTREDPLPFGQCLGMLLISKVMVSID